MRSRLNHKSEEELMTDYIFVTIKAITITYNHSNILTVFHNNVKHKLIFTHLKNEIKQPNTIIKPQIFK